MAFDQELGERVANSLRRAGLDFQEKRMFGGLGFMINDKMCVGIVKDKLMVRVLDENTTRSFRCLMSDRWILRDGR